MTAATVNASVQHWQNKAGEEKWRPDLGSVHYHSCQSPGPTDGQRCCLKMSQAEALAESSTEVL